MNDESNDDKNSDEDDDGDDDKNDEDEDDDGEDEKKNIWAQAFGKGGMFIYPDLETCLVLLHTIQYYWHWYCSRLLNTMWLKSAELHRLS